MPSLVLIDGGLGQLHAAAQSLEALEIINQPLASIASAKKSSTSTDRKTTPSFSTIIPRLASWSK